LEVDVPVIPGWFYKFRRETVISRAGQPLQTKTGIEIGAHIAKEDAVKEVQAGRDVYTLNIRDATDLAEQAGGGRKPGEPIPHAPHHPPQPSPTGREDVYYPHIHPFQPKSTHAKYGHVFYGQRGDGYVPRD